MSDFESLLAQYDYPLHPEQIAARPASPRDSSKLLIYDRATKSTQIDVYSHIYRYIPKGSLLVFNETRVIPARIVGRVATGGKVELLCTRFGGNELLALSERGLSTGEQIWLNKKTYLKVIRKTGKEYQIGLPRGFNIRKYMRRHGVTPLPPYLKHSPLSEKERRVKYQTIFAKKDGSIAAPTASLHFTKRLIAKLNAAGIETAFITLHVNLGTFMPLTEENVASGLLHEERFEIPGAALKKIEKAKKAGHLIVPVGTTALRALESAYAGARVRPSGMTRLFIREGYRFKVANGLITNYHVPRSSLMMLVASLVGRKKLLELYSFAGKSNFRFLSFGDGMLVR